MLIKKTMKTDRLLLRRWTVRDRFDLFDYAKLDNVGPRAGWAPHSSVEQSRRVIQKSLRAKGTFAIVLRGSGKVIGSIGLHSTSVCANQPDSAALELGYVLHPDFWGNGYTAEATRAVIRYAFVRLGIDTIWCGHFAGNKQSQRVCEKCGFVFVYEKETAVPQLGNQRYREMIYNLTKERFFNIHSKEPTE